MKGGAGLVGALLVVSALGVARTQPRLARAAKGVKEQDEVYALPPPVQLKAFVLGYDAAAVDLLWAKLLVEFGIHWHEKREFHPDPYIDAILALEPSYDRIYRFADTLLCYHPLHASEADVRKTRAILERGTRERPWDFEVWQEYGQFSAFLGPGFLKSADNAEKDRWRRDGALALVKAVDLGAPGSGALIAATLLQQSGDRDAEIESLRRAYAYNYDDPEMRDEIAGKLERLEASARNETEAHAMATLSSIWRTDWPLLTKTQFLLLGPAPDAARCAGPGPGSEPACARDWDPLLESAGTEAH
jgi:hypothetical protein